MQTQEQTGQTETKATETETTETKVTETKATETLTLAKAESLAASMATEYTIADVTVAAQSFRRSVLRASLKARLTPPKAS